MNVVESTLAEIQNTLSENGVDYQKIIDDFGQVKAYLEREANKEFSLQDHVRGLILALLSNQRPWGPIAENMCAVKEAFHNFEPEALKTADPKDIEERVRELKCGNRQIGKQCKFLSSNINTLEKIALEYGSVDAYITSDIPEKVAKNLSNPGPKKLHQVGFTLAMEYLRNVGINVIKPDLHICRIIGPERLAIVETTPSPEQAYDALMEWSKNVDKPAVWIDNLLWLFAAKDYAAICTKDPRCEVCQVTACRKKAN